MRGKMNGDKYGEGINGEKGRERKGMEGRCDRPVARNLPQGGGGIMPDILATFS